MNLCSVRRAAAILCLAMVLWERGGYCMLQETWRSLPKTCLSSTLTISRVGFIFVTISRLTVVAQPGYDIGAVSHAFLSIALSENRTVRPIEL